MVGVSSATKRRQVISSTAITVSATALLLFSEQPSSADESGISFWLPGTFGSLAATPGTPGWALGTIYYHTTVNAGSNVATAVALPRFPPATLSLNLNADIHASADIAILAPTYTFATPVLDGQLALTLIAVYGQARTNIDATLTGALGPIGFGTAASIGDSVTSLGDLLPQATLKWHSGVNNFMVYGIAGIPIGDYEAGRIANLGKGHVALDGGFGYTYFNPATGHEFSAVSGLTYNFKNTHTDYQNGIDWHLDWGASKFLTKHLHVGAVGYFYSQLTGDSGTGAKLGDYMSRVAAIGPQIGFSFPVGEMQGYLNLRGYWEFAAVNRSSGWNTWLTFAISPAAPSVPPIPMLHK